MLLFIIFRDRLIFTENWLRLHSTLIWVPRSFLFHIWNPSKAVCQHVPNMGYKWVRMKEMDYDDLCITFILLYISKNTFTSILCHSLDITWESITTHEGRTRNIKVTYSRSQSQQQQHCPPVLLFTLWRGLGCVPQCWGQPHVSEWLGSS